MQEPRSLFLAGEQWSKQAVAIFLAIHEHQEKHGKEIPLNNMLILQDAASRLNIPLVRDLSERRQITQQLLVVWSGLFDRYLHEGWDLTALEFPLFFVTPEGTMILRETVTQLS